MLKDLDIDIEPYAAWEISPIITQFAEEKSKSRKILRLTTRSIISFILKYETVYHSKASYVYYDPWQYNKESIATLGIKNIIFYPQKGKRGYILKINFQPLEVEFYTIFWLAWNELINSRKISYDPTASGYKVAKEILRDDDLNDFLSEKYNKTLRNEFVYIAKWENRKAVSTLLNVNRVVEEINIEANRTVADLVSFFVHFRPQISLNQRDRILIKKTVNEIAEKLGDRVSSVNRIITDIVFLHLARERT